MGKGGVVGEMQKNWKKEIFSWMNEWKLYLSVYVFSYKLMGDTVN